MVRAQLLLSPLRVVSSAKHLTSTMFFSVIFQFNYHEFMDSWQQSVPEGMVTKSAHLAVSTMGGKQMRRFVDIFYNRNLKFLEHVLLPAISLVSVTTPFAHHQNNNNNIQLSPEGEVNSGGYIPRREASRYISTALHRP